MTTGAAVSESLADVLHATITNALAAVTVAATITFRMRPKATVGPTRLRAVMAAVYGSCQLPVAAYAARHGDRLQLDGFLAEPDGTRPRRLTVDVPYPSSVDEARRVGFALGAELAGS